MNCVMQASGVQVLEWKHQKNALMEDIVTQLVLDIVFYVQKVIGEVYQHFQFLFIQHTCNGWPIQNQTLY